MIPKLFYFAMCSQIWVSTLVDYGETTYLTNSKRKTLIRTVPLQEDDVFLRTFTVDFNGNRSYSR